MSSILNAPDILAAVQERKMQKKQALNASRQRLQKAMQNLTAPLPKTTGKASNVSRMVSTGFMIYNGTRIGLKIFTALRSLFGRRRRR